MILEACRKKEGRGIYREYGTGGGVVHEGYGELCHSQRFLAKAWGWSRGKVRLYLDSLSGSEIEQKTAHGITVISIINFDMYQNPDKHEKAHGKPTESPLKAQTITRKHVKIKEEDKRSVPGKPERAKKSRRKNEWI